MHRYYLDKAQAGERAGEDGGAREGGGTGEERAAPRPLDADELLRQAEEEANIDQVRPQVVRVAVGEWDICTREAMSPREGRRPHSRSSVPHRVSRAHLGAW